MKIYDFKKSEEKWKEYWLKNNIYKAVDFSPKPKKYILAELPYPSGKYLHIGHAMRYTVPEIYSRFLRMRGYNVMFPLGWDSFGLPTEVFAIKEGITPKTAIEQACRDFKKVVQNVGYAIDWDREITTSNPDYYKWTQWIFLKLWEKGFAEVKEMPVWWCKELGVLADEEIITNEEGKKISEKGSHLVERKMFKQWVLKIPRYAEKLLEGLEEVNFPESIKAAQRSWIGKKEGVEVDFEIDGHKVSVFTTRPDTLYGVTFLALSPQNEVLDKLLTKVTNEDTVKEYIENSKQLSDIEKQTKEKTGVKLEGIFAVHPLNEIDKKIPVFVADYIISDYGTGAVMGVPAHDDRDYDFAKKYSLEIIEVVEKPADYSTKLFTGEGIIKNSGEYNGKYSAEFKKIIAERLKKEDRGRVSVTYKLRDQIWSRQRFWGDPIPLIHRKDGKVEADYDLPVELPEIDKNTVIKGEAFAPLSEFKDWIKTVDSDGNPAERETDTMPTWAGSNWYYLRYIDPKNDQVFADKEKMKYWLPVDHYFGGSEHTTVHLLYSRFWHRFLFDNGYVPIKEPYERRTNGGILLGPDGFKMSKSRGNVLNPQDVIDNYGADVLRTYIAFIGPYEDTYPWNPTGVKACWRLINTTYNLKDSVNSDEPSAELKKGYNTLVKKVTDMCENLKMNTSVSEIMIFVNLLKKEKYINKDIWKGFLRVLAPFAPFIAEELWFETNGYTEWKPESSIHLADWPKYDEKLLEEDTLELPIQVNGKLRASVKINKTDTKDQVMDAVLNLDKIKEMVKDKEIKNFIYINGKIVNIVL